MIDFQLFEREEALLPELEDYLEENEHGWVNLKHPLVFSIMHSPQMNCYVNEALRQKKAAIEKRKAEGDWGGVVWLYEKPYRIMAFRQIVAPKVSNAEYWQIVGEILVNVENLWQCKDDVRAMLRSKRAGRENIMDEEERAAFEALPADLKIYRGCSRLNPFGWSWTLSKEKAEWFAKRFGRERPRVRELTVKKEEALAYFTRRNEEEIFLRRMR